MSYAKTESNEVRCEDLGNCALDISYVGTLGNGVRAYQYTLIDVHAKIIFAKLVEQPTGLTAAEFIIEQVIPFYQTHGIPLRTVAIDRGFEFAGNFDLNEYRVDITVSTRPTRGIIERFLHSVRNEFYRTAFKKKHYETISDLKIDLGRWLYEFSEDKDSSIVLRSGKRPMETFLDALRSR